MARTLPQGSALVLRDYGDSRRRARAFALRSITAARGVLLIVGGDLPLAHAVRADGVHWRSDQLDGAQSAPGLIVTAAAHGATDLALAGRLGADLAFLSPVYATASHPDVTPLGPSRFRALAAASPVPVLALGGVDEGNAADLGGSNVAGVAAVGAFAVRWTSPSPDGCGR